MAAHGQLRFPHRENGLPLVRCSNNGVTCLIDGHGRIENVFRDKSGSEYGTGTLTVEIPLLQPPKIRRTFTTVTATVRVGLRGRDNAGVCYHDCDEKTEATMKIGACCSDMKNHKPKRSASRSGTRSISARVSSPSLRSSFTLATVAMR